jgi:hypothetical protein
MGKVNIKREIGYFYTLERKGDGWIHICRYCGKEFKNLSTRHIEKYHSDEMDFSDHIKAHKDKKCGCSGIVYEN